jgi:Antitoxin VbhA
MNAFEQAKATIELEGFKLTAEDEKIIKAVATGKMTRDQLIEDLSSEEKAL